MVHPSLVDLVILALFSYAFIMASSLILGCKSKASFYIFLLCASYDPCTLILVSPISTSIRSSVSYIRFKGM